MSSSLENQGKEKNSHAQHPVEQITVGRLVSKINSLSESDQKLLQSYISEASALSHPLFHLRSQVSSLIDNLSKNLVKYEAYITETPIDLLVKIYNAIYEAIGEERLNLEALSQQDPLIGFIRDIRVELDNATQVMKASKRLKDSTIPDEVLSYIAKLDMKIQLSTYDARQKILRHLELIRKN